MDRINEEIASQISATREEVRQLEKALQESKEKLARLVQARLCAHDWREVGSFMYAQYECKRCRFSFIDG
jgi:hypothetical protein